MEYLDKLVRIQTLDDRVILAFVKSLDYRGNVYLSNTVEVFNRDEGFVSNFEIYENSKEVKLKFESETNEYQIIGDSCINKSNIKSVHIKQQ